MTALRNVLPATLMVLLAACAGASGDQAAADTDSATIRDRREALGESSLPGAAGVTGALGAADSAASRNAQLDSLDGE